MRVFDHFIVYILFFVTKTISAALQGVKKTCKYGASVTIDLLTSSDVIWTIRILPHAYPKHFHEPNRANKSFLSYNLEGKK